MRIVVKVGTSTLAHATGRMNIRHVEDLVKVLSDLKNAGHEVILVWRKATQNPAVPLLVNELTRLAQFRVSGAS